MHCQVEEYAKQTEQELSLRLTNYPLRHEGVWGSGCIDTLFLTSAVDEGEWSASRLGERAPDSHWTGG
jgi:hypothetical protein